MQTNLKIYGRKSISLVQGQDSRHNARAKVFDLLVNGIAPNVPDELPDEQTAEAERIAEEKRRCSESAEYFIENYVQIYDTTEKQGRWIPFELWDAQKDVLEDFELEKMLVVLKARQNGLTWLALAFALWQMLFRPIAFVIVYSLRDTEAKAMLSDDKLFGMYKRLPEWMRFDFIEKNNHKWRLTNGSTIIAVPSTAGDSYTATLAIVDEADLIPDLNTTLQRVQPTIDAGGKLMLISRSNKKVPNSVFKKIYRAAKTKANEYKAIFLPWFARPSRTVEWYNKQKQNSLASTESLDNLYESYPATDVEALAPSTLDKRLPLLWLNKCYSEQMPSELDKILISSERAKDALSIPRLRLYKLPVLGRLYRIGCDPAEGNPNSNDTSIQVVDYLTGEQVAVVNGKIEPTTTADYIVKLSKFYNNAPALVERNNHGHTVIAEMKHLRGRLLQAEDEKDGYLSNKRTKVILYDDCAETLRTDDCIIHDFETFNQLSLIEGNSLLAPEGESDDLADGFALAQKARSIKFIPPNAGVMSFGKTKGW